MKNKSMTRLLSILLAVVMVFTIMPSDVYASKGKTYYSTKYKLDANVRQETGCDMNCGEYATKNQPLKYVDDVNRYGDYVGWTGFHKDCNNNYDVPYGHRVNTNMPVQFTDAKLKGTALSDKKVKISWTKCDDADGYQIILSTRVSESQEADKNSTTYINKVSYPTKYRTIKTINKNVNSITLSTPKAVDKKFDVVHNVYCGKNEYTKVVNNEQGAFYIRYRAYKIVNNKKVWSDWSQMVCVSPKGKNYEKMVKSLNGYKGKYDFSELYYHNEIMSCCDVDKYMIVPW